MASRRRLINLIKAAVPLLKRQILVDAIDVVPVAGEVPVIEIAFAGSERLPIYVTDAGSQLLCISYLWRDADVRPRLRGKLLETLLDLNPSVPLSSFGRIGEHFVLVGALSPAASAADMALELATLGDNGRDALTALADFLV
ncbi:DUF2170 family protein [Tahibacter sp.]|uniref:DUF2170 family protein n=1 Tax=Tahibacter sp. TaxID=2056211 RepID=UPI0028C3E5E3|nr:DUF2170 family protein [Tahibacter sp.]